MKAALCFATIIYLAAGVSPQAAATGQGPRNPQPTTLTVCPDGSAQYTTIQAAINVAAAGDIILLCDAAYTGTGNRDLDYNGKAITIRSASGNPETCIIDCQGQAGNGHRAFLFHSGEGPNALLADVTIRNGYVEGGANYFGGAIWCRNNSSPTFEHVIFMMNHADCDGGALCCDYSSPSLTACEFYGNSAPYGGAVHLDQSSASFDECLFIGNSALPGLVGSAGFGGGAHVTGVMSGQPSFIHCQFILNDAHKIGGGAACNEENGIFSGCTFARNTVNGTSEFGGGGLFIYGCEPIVEHCTFAHNYAPVGTHLYFSMQSAPAIQNCILAFGNGNEAAHCQNSTPSFTCCDIWEPTSTLGCAGPIGSSGNISVDPIFCDDGNDDYTLRRDSPCTAENYPACGLIGAWPVGCEAPHDFELWQELMALRKSAAAWGDFDNDGDLDLALSGENASGQKFTLTYQNQNGSLSLYANDLIGVSNESSGSLAWGDCDGDGDLDLIVAGNSASGPVTRLYLNDGVGNLSWDNTQPLVGVGHASVSWGDVDHDGDLDLLVMGYDGAANVTTVYENDPPGSFTPVSGLSLVGLRAGAADWADWDGDGDVDLMMVGHNGTSRQVIFYKNDGAGQLNDDGTHGLPGLSLCDAAWGDYDNDGDLDLALTGEISGSPSPQRCARIYQNTGNGTLTMVVDLSQIYRSSCAWGDHDNDGDLDIAFCGYTGSDIHTTIYTNTGAGFASAFNLFAVNNGSVSWADVDTDGDLDFFVTGQSWLPADRTYLYRNVGVTPNAAPSAPTTLQCQYGALWGTLTFSWSGAADAETPAAGLYYCLRVGTSPGAHDVMSGTYGTPLMGNLGQATSRSFDIPPGTYYWSVRTIDAGLRASPWAAEVISVPPGPLHYLRIDVSKDAYVRSGAPGTPFGAADPTHLISGWVSGVDTARVYLGFEVGTLGTGYVVSADLHLYCYGAGAEPYYVDAWEEGVNTWNENTITWLNAPQLFGPAVVSRLRVRPSRHCHWNVLGPVQAAMHVSGQLTLVLRNGAPPEGAPGFIGEYWSDEAAVVPSQKPYLTVWYVPDYSTAPEAPPEASTSRLALDPGCPSPFQHETMIRFELREQLPVRLGIWDMSGRLVRSLLEGPRAAGEYTIGWNGRDACGLPAPSGVYFLRLEAGSLVRTRQVVLAR